MSTMIVSLTAFFALGITLAQNQPAAPSQDKAETQLLGRGRGGDPFAWNDRNKDGICDLTGQPVGQGRPIGYGRGRGGARGYARGDSDGDGVCDLTGRPVRTGRPFSASRGRGRWAGARYGSSTPAPQQTPSQPRQ